MADAVSLRPAPRPDTVTGPAMSVRICAVFRVPDMLRGCPLGMSLGPTSSLVSVTSPMSLMTMLREAAIATASSVIEVMPVILTSSKVTFLPKTELARMATLHALSYPSMSLVGSVSAYPSCCASFRAWSKGCPLSILLRM